jgi:hypothetical protein
MTEQELESLPYPMFKTNWYEKMLLRKALKIQSCFLCNRLSYIYLPILSLKSKVLLSIGGGAYNSLNQYLHECGNSEFLLCSDLTDCNLRNIWIRKLLTYKGE